MPKVKSEKRSEVSAAPYESPVKNGNGTANGDNGHAEEEKGAVGTVPTAGFRDAGRARLTLEQLRERDSAYQYQVVTSLMRRAKTILSHTKDTEKVANLTEAIKVFDDWVNDYKAHNRSRENFNYLPLESMEGYEALAERYGIKSDKPSENFLQVFRDLKGDSRALRTTKVPGSEEGEDEETITWDIQRNRHLKDINGRIRKEYIPLFETDQPLRGLPSKEHTQMIMWGYSPEPTKIKKCIPQIAEKLKAEN
ncbi:hypothetical protein R5R35_006597 [Gryllus longicercus]|uniref:Uncharacterized protein n=1 Tax=Gryllus longicercus TaxID=2509291 RepID=A0AAN9Z9F8_9ORTH